MPIDEYTRGLVKAYAITEDRRSEDEDNHLGREILCEIAVACPEFYALCEAHLIKTGYVLTDGMWTKSNPPDASPWKRAYPLSEGRSVVLHCGAYTILAWPPYRTLRGWDARPIRV